MTKLEKTAQHIISFRKLKNMKFRLIEEISPLFAESFGKITYTFTMMVWGGSGMGKSNFLFQFVREMARHGKVLYVALEESHSMTLQNKLSEQLNHTPFPQSHNVKFADHAISGVDRLREVLNQPKSARFVIIDSIQYFDVNYQTYKRLKEDFKQKSFIFISHARGREPLGRTAESIRYDVDIKVRVEGFIGFVTTRFIGGKPWVIWEEGAKKYWGKKFQKVIA